MGRRGAAATRAAKLDLEDAREQLRPGMSAGAGGGCRSAGRDLREQVRAPGGAGRQHGERARRGRGSGAGGVRAPERPSSTRNSWGRPAVRRYHRPMELEGEGEGGGIEEAKAGGRERRVADKAAEEFEAVGGRGTGGGMERAAGGGAQGA